jgi:preprotein translocase subunit SecE
MAENEKKTEKKVKAEEKKPSFFSRIGAWFRSLKAECKKITWASAKLCRQNTIVVVISVAIVGAVLALLDFAFNQTIQGLNYLI